MKVSPISSQLYNEKNKQAQKHAAQNPSFRSALLPVLGASGFVMQKIESMGYFISFLIQDGLGMTLPRIWTGYNRDREITGKFNFQEGKEVTLREGLTGPYIIAVAPFTIWAAGKFCKSTNTNTRLIKRFGAGLKEMVSSPNFDKTIQSDAEKFKKEFYKKSVKEIYEQTILDDKNKDKTIEQILVHLEASSAKKKKDREAALAQIQSIINTKMLESSSELYNINKVYVGNKDNKLLFSTTEAFAALRDYAHDAIVKNKNRATIDETAAENIKNNFATKRLGINIFNVVATLVGLSFIPKLYAKSDVAPGVHSLELAKELKEAKEKQNDNEQTSFKGKGINNDGIISKLGKYITKYVPEKFQELTEYAGINFTKTTFACLSTFGLLLPRGKRAWDRAQKDENGKRDMTEIHEILLRDTVSSLSVVFAVPMLTKMIVRTYEDKLGFILTNRASDGKTTLKKIWDTIWPYSDLEVLSVADLDAIYGNIDNKEKLKNFTNFVDKKGGDLAKILSKSKNAAEVFNEKTFTLESIKKLSPTEKNKKIIEFFDKQNLSDEVITKLMKGSGEIKNNQIAKFARGLNSLPGAISTFIISPIILGILIPKLTYYNTRQHHAKKLANKQN